jgi:hypothetical protein
MKTRYNLLNTVGHEGYTLLLNQNTFENDRPVVALIVQEQGCNVRPPRPVGYIVCSLYIRTNRDPLLGYRQKVSIVLAYVDNDDDRDYQLGI